MYIVGYMTTEKSKKVLLLDIDYTIFDSDIYREFVYSDLAKELGYNSFEEFYPLAKKITAKVKSAINYYNPDLVLNELLSISKTKTDLKKIEKIFWNDEIYRKSLYAETKSILIEIKNRDIIIGILSTGHSRHQMQKIKIISDFFYKEHIHIFTDKIQNLDMIIDKYRNDRLIIVDDLPMVLSEAKKRNKAITTVFVKRDKKYETTKEIENFIPDKTIMNLHELEPILAEYN